MEIRRSKLRLYSRQCPLKNSRKRGPNETPLPHPQVSGGLGLGYMATSHAFLIFVIQKLEISCETAVSYRNEDARVP